MNHQDAKGTKIGAEGGCAWLDDYLDSELGEDEVVLFEGHLVGCDQCAEAVEQQRWLDGVLRSPRAAELESAPRSALAKVAAAADRRRRVAVAVALAAALAAIAAWPASRVAPPETPEEGLLSVAAAPGHHPAETTEHPSSGPSDGASAPARFVSTGDAIVVPVAVESPDVTVVQVYSTVDAQRRTHLAAELSALTAELNGG